MQPDAARRLLGVTPDTGPDDVRAAYRRLVRQQHPDRNTSSDATERTIELTSAYRLLVELAAAPSPGAASSGAASSGAAGSGAGSSGAGPSASGPPPPRPSSSRRPPEPTSAPLELTIELVDDTTIALGAPSDETLFLLCETAHRLGEITYLDPSAGLVEVIVEFVEAPTSSVVFTLQGRATGVTDVFCTVEPLSGGEAPPVDAVTRLVLDTVTSVATDHHRHPVPVPSAQNRSPAH